MTSTIQQVVEGRASNTGAGECEWNGIFQRLLEYRFEHGDWDVPNSYPNDSLLGAWVTRQRSDYRHIQSGRVRRELTSLTLAREAKLNQVGFQWRLESNDKIYTSSMPLVAGRSDNKHATIGAQLDKLTRNLPSVAVAGWGSNKLATPFQYQKKLSTSNSVRGNNSSIAAATHKESVMASLGSTLASIQATLQRRQSVPEAGEPSYKTGMSVPSRRNKSLAPSMNYSKMQSPSNFPLHGSDHRNIHTLANVVATLGDSLGNKKGQSISKQRDPLQKKSLEWKVGSPNKKIKTANSNQKSSSVYAKDIGRTTVKQKKSTNNEPNENDVIIGGGKKGYNHIGNVRFRLLIEKMMDEYWSASRSGKSIILKAMVANVRRDGTFMKRDTFSGEYRDVGEFSAREMTSQAFRNAKGDAYSSSLESKRKRKARNSKGSDAEEDRKRQKMHLSFHEDVSSID